MALLYIGVDPGKGGGIAAVTPDGALVHVAKMPETERDLLDLFLKLDEEGQGGARAMLERVHSLPSQGHSGAFTFGQGYGQLTMALTAAQIPFDKVSPIKWQNALGCRSGGDKNITKRKAQDLFPNAERITHAVADAILLAEYARRLGR